MENIMTTMDVKAISWVGDMYQKFEAMCVEVEENVYQDSVKYVESQVKTVGTCVKRFYSDVVQDLLPVSSDDLLKPENSGLKSDLYVESEKIKSEIVVLSSDSHLSSQLDEIVDNKLSSKESDPEVVEPKLDLLTNDEESTSGLNSVNLRISYSAVLEEFDTARISDAVCNEAVWDEFEIDDVENEAFSEQISKVMLEESCVLVDKYEQFCDSPLEGKPRSYKKKIRDVFQLRKWSSSKNFKEDTIREMTVCASTTESSSSSLESGWEIL